MRVSIVSLLFFPLITAAGQETPPIPVSIFGQTQTTGMVGITVNQTARLNVLNSASPLLQANPLPLRPCKVTLTIFDEQGAQLKQLVVDNLPPRTAKSLDFPGPVAVAGMTPVALRIQVRGAVSVSPGPLPEGMAQWFVFPIACTVVPTLEVFDNDTGKTMVVLTNPSFVSTGIVPLFTTGTPPVQP
jgi:hypothetical protein